MTSLFGYLFRKLDKTPVFLGQNINLSSHHVTQNRGLPSDLKVSIVIPTRDKAVLLKRCIDSIRHSTNDLNIELIIVDNNSKEAKTLRYLDELRRFGATIISYSEKFNYSEICNIAAKKATGDYLCFLNNDTEALEPNWLSSMVHHASEPSTGIVGAVLTFPDGKLQHMGIALGYTGVAGHPGRGKTANNFVPNNCYQVSAVTFACAVISANKFKLLGGLNPDFPVAFNDVDIAIRATSANLVNVMCTHAHLLHGESQTRNRTFSFGGFLQGINDVLLLLKRHSKSLTENFFVRRVLSDEFSQ